MQEPITRGGLRRDTLRQTHYPPIHFWTKAFIFKMFGYICHKDLKRKLKKALIYMDCMKINIDMG